MAITPKDLAEVIGLLAELGPYVRLPSGKAMGLLWATLPPRVYQELTVEHLAYASEQYLLDPYRPDVMPVHLALLRYLYRLENGFPNFNWGLRQDLSQRLASNGFQPLPASEADLHAQHGLPNYDGARQEPAGVLAHLTLLPPLPSNGNGISAALGSIGPTP
jgi:hypothetical protein